jgi:hypothetical protein
MCENTIKFPDDVLQDWSGDLLCRRCGALLHIKLVKGKVKQSDVKRYNPLGWGVPKEGQPSEALLRLQEMAQKALAQPTKSNEPRDQST